MAQQPETRPDAPEQQIVSWVKSRLALIYSSPRLVLILGGTLVVVVIAAVALQMRTPAEGVAQVSSAGRTRGTGTTRVRPVRKVQHMARIATTGGKTNFITRDELAKECIARIGAEVLDELVNRKVIELECGRRRITVTDAEVKQEVVRLCLRHDRSIGQVARELDLTESALRKWVKQYEIDHGPNPTGALTTEEKTELRTLRREVRVLREEREILGNRRQGNMEIWAR